MREVLGSVQHAIGWMLWLLEQAWHSALSFAARVAGAWPEGEPWKQISFLILVALLSYAAFTVSRTVAKGVHYIFNVLACLLVLSMAIVPTVVVTFLALAGAFWIAKSF
jgi:hypothetical protein